jgi:glycosyltransferase involved in cell wall biosynthesis
MKRHALVLLEALPYAADPRVRAQAATLRDLGWTVTVGCPAAPGAEPSERAVADGIRLAEFRSPPAGFGAGGYALEYGLALLRLARVARAVARRRRVDVVLVCTPPDLLVAVTRPLSRAGAAVLFDYREISPELYEAKFGRRGLPHRALLAAERYAFRHADAVTTVSEPCAELARRRGAVDPARVFLVGNGPDAARVRRVAPRPELRRGRRHLVLWLGVMSRQEGLGRLVEVAELVVRARGRDDAHFAIVGDGEARAGLVGEVRRRGLEDVVELPGAVGDELVRAYVSTADVCVGVDERNAMNDRAAMRKVLEYMAIGKPVVQFPLTEMRRLCGDAAVYARDADAADMAERVCELLDDPERRRALGDAARRRAAEGLMWSAQEPALAAAVDAALAGAARRRRRAGASRDIPFHAGHPAKEEAR